MFTLFNGNWSDTLYIFCIRAFIAVTVLPIHEWAHGYVAYRMGDDTAKRLGRLSLNPLRHLDPIGAVALVFTGIGWAKPVPINPNNFQKRKLGMALSALAGPMSNFLIAVIGVVLLKISGMIMYDNHVYYTDAGKIIREILSIVIQVNISLAVFNLLPIPPLDGSRLASYFLPEKTYFGIMKYERIFMLALMIALFMGYLDRPLEIITDAAIRFLDIITYPIDWIYKML
ncbi:MAG: site-2 protease family protein [Oscillospiraceae bacterium]|nr:site-2 protease family protein [Oscillospiraceae bacterium]